MMPPDPADALSFDEAEAAGLDGTLRTVGHIYGAPPLRRPLEPIRLAANYVERVRTYGPRPMHNVAGTGRGDYPPVLGQRDMESHVVTIAYEVQENDDGWLLEVTDLDDDILEGEPTYWDIRWDALLLAARIAIDTFRFELGKDPIG